MSDLPRAAPNLRHAHCPPLISMYCVQASSLLDEVEERVGAEERETSEEEKLKKVNSRLCQQGGGRSEKTGRSLRRWQMVGQMQRRLIDNEEMQRVRVDVEKKMRRRCGAGAYG